MRMRLSALLTLSCALLCTGCAYTHLSQHPDLAPSRTPADEVISAAPKVQVVLYFRELKFNAPDTGFFSSHWSKSSAQRKLTRVLKEFSAFTADLDASAVPSRMVIEATHDTEGNLKVSTLCRLTKYIVPCTEEHRIVVDAVLTREGQAPKTYEAAGSYRVRKHLLWLLLPFRWHRSVPGDTAMNAFRDVLIQAERDVAP
jgi:hypothetical protein